MLFGNTWVVKESFRRILVFKIFLTVQFLLLLLPAATFFVKPSAATSAVLLAFDLGFNFFEDVFHTLVLRFHDDDIIVIVIVILVVMCGNQNLRFGRFGSHWNLKGGFSLKAGGCSLQRFFRLPAKFGKSIFSGGRLRGFFLRRFREVLWNWSRSNDRGDNIPFLFKFFNGLTLLALQVCLDVFWLSGCVINRWGGASCRLPISLITPAAMLLRSILCKRIELLPTPPSSVDW